MTDVKKHAKFTALLLAAALTMVSVFGAFSAPAFAAAKKPAKVSGVKVSAKSNYSIKISWKKAKNAKKYQVYRSVSKKGKYKKIATVKTTSYTSSNLLKGKKYYYKVRAVNGNKKGSYSAVKYVSTKKSALYDVLVDKETKTVTISARLDGKYFHEPTRHLIIDRSGFNKGKGMLTSYCTPDDLYNALVKAGGVSWSKSEGKTLRNGEKNTVKNAENKSFSKIDVSIGWGDEMHPLEECLTTVEKGTAAPEIDMIFSGNPKAAAKTPSGCITCMDSCYIGIVANRSYGLCWFDDKDHPLFAREDVLPEDGTVVKVMFRIK